MKMESSVDRTMSTHSYIISCEKYFTLRSETNLPRKVENTCNLRPQHNLQPKHNGDPFSVHTAHLKVETKNRPTSSSDLKT